MICSESHFRVPILELLSNPQCWTIYDILGFLLLLMGSVALVFLISFIYTVIKEYIE